MKALTLWQPWATFMAHNIKTIETRSWATRYRGPLAIHAAKRIPEEARLLCHDQPFSSWLKLLGYTIGTLPLGVVVAEVELTHCYTIRESNVPSSFEQQFGDYTPGRIAWCCRFVLRYQEPIPARGSQGLWEWDNSDVRPKW